MSSFLYPPPDIRQPVVIVNDGGGIVADYEKAAFRYNVERRRVEIRGSCRSACQLALSVENVCVGKNAVVKFHHAYNLEDGTPRLDITNEMLSALPKKIRYAVEGKITVNYNPNATLDYNKLVSLGIPDCDDPIKTQTADRAVPYDPTRPSVAYKSSAKYTSNGPKAVNGIVSILKLPLLPLEIAARAITGNHR